MPQVHHSRSWFKAQPLAVWGSVGLVFLGGGVVAVAMGLGLVGAKKSSPSPAPNVQTSPKPVEVKAETRTAEQVRVDNNTVRTDGIISSISSTTITFSVTGQSKSVTLKLNDTTLYMHGSRGETAAKDDIKQGQKAVAAYDTSSNTASSIWGGYDE